MEFEEEEEEEHEEEEEEDMEIPTPPAPAYELPVTNSASGKPKVLVGPNNNNNNNHPTTSSATTMMTRYRECLKNHALGMGGHAVDGCGEFLAAGEEGTLDALKCAACNCHRNFHRKVVNDHHHRSSSEVYHHYQQQFTPYYHHHHHRSPQPPHHSGYLHMTSTLSQHHQRPPLALPAASGGGGQDLEDMSNPSSSGGGGGGGGGGTSSGGGSKKRFRTKFSQEQKEKMLQFAESLGWRIQKHDEAAVDQFCADTGVRRQVLKVWMHNNKHTLELGKRYADENVREV